MTYYFRIWSAATCTATGAIDRLYATWPHVEFWQVSRVVSDDVMIDLGRNHALISTLRSVLPDNRVLWGMI